MLRIVLSVTRGGGGYTLTMGRTLRILREWGEDILRCAACANGCRGSGRVDYLCMERDGRTTAWLRDEDGKWSDAGQVKFSEDLDRANYRFADADGKLTNP